MIKAIVTSDWHIGNYFHGYDRTEDHKAYFRQLSELIAEERPDVLFICGDIFDNANPSAGSQHLYFETLDKITSENEQLQVVIIAGNHDSASRLEAPSPFLLKKHITVIGTVRKNGTEWDYARHVIPVHSLQHPSEKLLCLAVPYLREGDYPKAESYGEGVRAFISETLKTSDVLYPGNYPRVLLAHLYATGSEIAEGSSERIIVGGSEQVNTGSWSPEIVYTALGHIHRRQCVNGRKDMRYCGSALPMSFTERNYRHGADILTVDEEGSIQVTSKDFSLIHPLLSYPEKPLPWDTLAKELQKLPDEEDEQAQECYLQVNVFIDTPDTALSSKIEDVLKHKKVKLCKIQPFYPQTAGDTEVLDVQSLDELQKLKPMDMLKKIYMTRNHTDMREELLPLVEQAIREAEEDKEDDR